MQTTRIRLTLLDGREQLIVGMFAPPADRVELERTFGISMGDLGPGAHEEWLLYLVWRASIRALNGQAAASFEEFLAALESYEFLEEADAPDPTAETPPTA